jgi:hypothetical protein
VAFFKARKGLHGSCAFIAFAISTTVQIYDKRLIKVDRLFPYNMLSGKQITIKFLSYFKMQKPKNPSSISNN